MRLTLIGCVALLTLAGCSNIGQQQAAEAALEWTTAAPSQACELLAPDTADAVAEQSDGNCVRALAAIERPRAGAVLGTELAGQNAQVRLENDVVFLALFPDGWRVTAADCQRDDPDPEVPYRCEVEP